MKLNYIKNGLMLLLLTGLVACDKYLDLEPAQSISENIALDSDRNVKNVLRGAYNEFRTAALYGGNTLRNAELLGGDGEILWVGTFAGPRQIAQKQMFAENEDARAQWMNTYRMINICNNVISALDVVNEEDRARVEGEALFLRALGHFDLVRFYAKHYVAGQTNNQLGVPVVLTATRGIDESSNVSRNTVQQVYDAVVADLIRAESLLPASNGVFAAKHAANALLARVYLQQGDYANARDRANTVIGSGVYQMRPTYASVFNNDNASSEDIFVTTFTTQDAASSMTIFWSVPEFGGRDGDIDILDGHLDLYEVGDQRRDLFFMGNGAMRSGKWNNQFGVVNLFRLAEMYLIRAESNFRLGTSVGASPAADINVTRTRAGLSPLDNVTLDEILQERRLELAHEGFKIHDDKRLQRNVGSLSYDDDKLVFPIPARELDANPNMVQNPGY
jgi:starch-binding outer membrane protein, SusD/RagB family